MASDNTPGGGHSLRHRPEFLPTLLVDRVKFNARPQRTIIKKDVRMAAVVALYQW
jgi:hypothetical protein